MIPAVLLATVAAIFLSLAPVAGAATPDEVEHRLKLLSEELRCLVCQNQTLADSNAGLAVDLRNQVRDMIEQGKSDSEIKEYLVARYGDFVLYRPPMKGTTLLLWFGPFALLLGGAAIWLLVQRRSRARRAEAAPPPEDARERARNMLEP